MDPSTHRNTRSRAASNAASGNSNMSSNSSHTGSQSSSTSSQSSSSSQATQQAVQQPLIQQTAPQQLPLQQPAAHQTANQPAVNQPAAQQPLLNDDQIRALILGGYDPSTTPQHINDQIDDFLVREGHQNAATPVQGMNAKAELQYTVQKSMSAAREIFNTLEKQAIFIETVKQLTSNFRVDVLMTGMIECITKITGEKSTQDLPRFVQKLKRPEFIFQSITSHMNAREELQLPNGIYNLPMDWPQLTVVGTDDTARMVQTYLSNIAQRMDSHLRNLQVIDELYSPNEMVNHDIGIANGVNKHMFYFKAEKSEIKFTQEGEILMATKLANEEGFRFIESAINHVYQKTKVKSKELMSIKNMIDQLNQRHTHDIVTTRRIGTSDIDFMTIGFEIEFKVIAIVCQYLQEHPKGPHKESRNGEHLLVSAEMSTLIHQNAGDFRNSWRRITEIIFRYGIETHRINAWLLFNLQGVLIEEKRYFQRRQLFEIAFGDAWRELSTIQSPHKLKNYDEFTPGAFQTLFDAPAFKELDKESKPTPSTWNPLTCWTNLISQVNSLAEDIGLLGEDKQTFSQASEESKTPQTQAQASSNVATTTENFPTLDDIKKVRNAMGAIHSASKNFKTELTWKHYVVKGRKLSVGFLEGEAYTRHWDTLDENLKKDLINCFKFVKKMKSSYPEPTLTGSTPAGSSSQPEGRADFNPRKHRKGKNKTFNNNQQTEESTSTEPQDLTEGQREFIECVKWQRDFVTQQQQNASQQAGYMTHVPQQQHVMSFPQQYPRPFFVPVPPRPQINPQASLQRYYQYGGQEQEDSGDSASHLTYVQASNSPRLEPVVQELFDALSDEEGNQNPVFQQAVRSM